MDHFPSPPRESSKVGGKGPPPPENASYSERDISILILKILKLIPIASIINYANSVNVLISGSTQFD